MLLHIVARGRIGRGPEAELVDRYLKRVSWPTKVTELPDTGGKLPERDGARLILLDEKGENLPSTALADAGWSDLRVDCALQKTCHRGADGNPETCPLFTHIG